jgi:hypothetical protein
MREWTSMICVESLHHQTFLFSLTVLLLAVLKDETSTDVASSSIPCPTKLGSERYSLPSLHPLRAAGEL